VIDEKIKERELKSWILEKARNIEATRKHEKATLQNRIQVVRTIPYADIHASLREMERKEQAHKETMEMLEAKCRQAEVIEREIWRKLLNPNKS